MRLPAYTVPLSALNATVSIASPGVGERAAERLLGGDVPQLEVPAVAAHRQRAAVGAEGERADGLRGVAERGREDVPQDARPCASAPRPTARPGRSRSPTASREPSGAKASGADLAALDQVLAGTDPAGGGRRGCRRPARPPSGRTARWLLFRPVSTDVRRWLADVPDLVAQLADRRACGRRGGCGRPGPGRGRSPPRPRRRRQVQRVADPAWRTSQIVNALRGGLLPGRRDAVRERLAVRAERQSAAGCRRGGPGRGVARETGSGGGGRCLAAVGRRRCRAARKR